MAVHQKQIVQLTHRHRRQASSHIGSSVDLRALFFFAVLGTPVSHGLEERLIDLVRVQQHAAHLA